MPADIFSNEVLECMRRIQNLENARATCNSRMEHLMREVANHQTKALEYTNKAAEEKKSVLSYEGELLQLKEDLREYLQPPLPELPFGDPNQRALDENIGRDE